MKQHTNLWQLKDDATVEATCIEPIALLYGAQKEREKERLARLYELDTTYHNHFWIAIVIVFFLSHHVFVILTL